MLFHTIDFFIFFSVFLAVYFPLKGGRWSIYVIAIFSVFFYGYWNWHYLPLLLVTVVVDFCVGQVLARQTDRRNRKIFLVLSLFLNFGILIYCKYLNFIFDLLFPLAEGERWKINDSVLPLGISFYVFQSVSYVVDVYRGRMSAVRNFVEYLSFVTFFPHLIAGPIQRGWQLLPQLLRPESLSFQRFSTAVYLFSKGLFYKGLGDLLASFHDPIFNAIQTAQPVMVVLAIVSFGLQIYLDFCGYSEMALGIARLLGVDLIRNFEEPYLARSPQEFWRRWHISLSNWLKDYLYITLGGSREGYWRRVFNVVFVMVVCGVWHGAGVGFVVWGLIHGLLIAFNISVREIFGRSTMYLRWVDSWLGGLCGWLLTFVCVNYAWLYFRLPQVGDFRVANQKVGQFLNGFSLAALPLTEVPLGLPVIMLMVLILDGVHRKVRQRAGGVVWGPQIAAFLGAVSAVFFALALLLNVGTSVQQFIYFQF